MEPTSYEVSLLQVKKAYGIYYVVNIIIMSSQEVTNTMEDDLWNIQPESEAFLNQACLAKGRARLVSWNCFGLHISVCVI